MRYFEKQSGWLKNLFGIKPTKGEALAKSIKGSLGYDDIAKGMLSNPKPLNIYGSQGLNEGQYLSDYLKKNKNKF